jgi:O-antigen ligase
MIQFRQERDEEKMIKSSVWSEIQNKDKGTIFLLASICIAIFTLVLMNVSSDFIGGFTSAVAIVIGALLFLIVLALRQYEFAVAMIVGAHIYIDWFLGREITGVVLAVGLLVLLFIVRSPQYPWATPRPLWLWCLFLALTIPPTLRGSHGNYELAFYYPNTIFGALVMFWLGTLIARNKMHLKFLFQVLAGLGALLALHTIIQTTTGIVIFNTSAFNTYLAKVANFGLANSSFSRAGSFFENPDWNGTFFAFMLFLPSSLFAESSSFLKKLFYFIEVLLMAVALLYTYSIGAWLGALAGVIAFVLFVGNNRYRVLVPLLMLVIGGILSLVFPQQLAALYQHAVDPAEVKLRSGAWQTAINVIKAFPLTGIGIGLRNYLQYAEPYRVPDQHLPLAHPHDSYLEWGAMAGLPVLAVFLVLLLSALWQAWRNWIQVNADTRCLLSGGIAAVVALSVNSVSINGWTLPPIAAVSWLILGAIASPFIRKMQSAEKGGDPAYERT